MEGKVLQKIISGDVVPFRTTPERPTGHIDPPQWGARRGLAHYKKSKIDPPLLQRNAVFIGGQPLIEALHIRI
jgi:hypothetical protein